MLKKKKNKGNEPFSHHSVSKFYAMLKTVACTGLKKTVIQIDNVPNSQSQDTRCIQSFEFLALIVHEKTVIQIFHRLYPKEGEK